MQYDLNSAVATNTDSTRDDRWEVQAQDFSGAWWTISDSSQMTQAEAESLAEQMRSSAPVLVWVVRDASGEYISGKHDGRRTPASDEAKVFDNREQALAACERATDKPLYREVQ